MTQAIKNRIGLTLALVVVLGAFVVLTQGPLSHGQGAKDGGSAGPRYTVVETEGHNLLVTDNATNTLYFYTIDQGQEIGSELKLRGSMDLNQVGKDAIQPKRVSKKQKETP